MIGFKVKKKRFSLLHLEENEFYVQDLTGSCTIYNFTTNTEKLEKCKIHICSKSVIIEPSDWETPIQKLLFKYMKSEPKKYADIIKQKYNDTSMQKLFDGKTGEDRIILHMKRIVEIPTSGPPSPYIVRDNLDLQVAIIPAFESLDRTMTKLVKLFEMGNQMKDSVDLEQKIKSLVFEDRSNKFDISHLESISERPILKNQIIARRILPLISIHGILYCTNVNIYFQSIHSVGSKPVKRIEISSINTIFKRRYELRHIGLEMFCDKRSYFFAFDSTEERDEVYAALLKRVRSDCISETSLERITQRWEREEMTNFEYLNYLNEAADRTFSDLTQYPVYPWVIKDYDSPTLDLNDPSIYRDLRKPIGALNPKRLADFKGRYNEMDPPKYLYGTHYSAPGYVIGYLIRKNPEYMLKLQSGRFDKPDRLFTTIKTDWENCLNNNGIVKELIPEFYGEDPSFLQNNLKLDLGVRQNGKRVNDVKVPKWAKNAEDYLRINREALESKYVSENLHHWIDLIFGFRQRGPQAIEADNVFHYITYEGSVDLDKVTNPNERYALRIQINEFGQTPKQLFKIPHPSRYAWKSLYPSLLGGISTNIEEAGELKMVEEEEKQEPKQEPSNVERTSQTREASKSIDKLPATSSNNIWAANGLKKLKVKKTPKIHKSEISSLDLLGNDRVLTTGGDGFIKIIDYVQQTIAKSFKVCELNIPMSIPLKENEIYALAGWDNNLYVFSLNYGNKIFNSNAHGDAFDGLTLMESQRLKNILLTSSWDCTIKSWKVRNNNIEKESDEIVVESLTPITSLASNKSGQLIAYGDVEGNLAMKDLKTEEEVFKTNVGGQKVIAVRFPPNNNNDVLVVTESAIALYSQSGEELLKSKADPANGLITAIDFNVNTVITATDKGHVSVYSLLQEKKMGSFLEEYESTDEAIPYPECEFSCCKISQDGTFGLFGSKCGSLTYVYYDEAKD